MKTRVERSSAMFIQGDLQAVFDALFTVGAIDPVLKMDWSKITSEAVQNPMIQAAINTINSCEGDRQMLVQKLHALDSKAVNYIAVEVAREFAEFTSRSELH
jgi:hypothetical protein